MVPEELRYSTDHEWVRTENGICTVGITEYAVELLGELTYVELPEVGAEFSAGNEAATVESVKAASDVYAPVSGRVAEVNSALEDTPELITESPYDKGWIFKLHDIEKTDIEELMDAAAYQQYIAELGE